MAESNGSMLYFKFKAKLYSKVDIDAYGELWKLGLNAEPPEDTDRDLYSDIDL